MNKQLNEVERLQILASILKENSVEKDSEIKIDDNFKDDFIDSILVDDPNADVDEILKLSPEEINDGYCHFWAEAFVDNFGGKHKYSNDFNTGASGGHHWVELNGKFYDAEAPQGVSSLKELPLIQREINRWLDSLEIQNF